MTKELPTISQLSRNFEIPRPEIRALIVEHEVGTDRIMNATVVDEAHLPRFLPILKAYAAKRARSQLTRA